MIIKKIEETKELYVYKNLAHNKTEEQTKNWNYDNQKIKDIAPYHPFLRSRGARASTMNFGHVKIVPKFLCIPRTPWVH